MTPHIHHDLIVAWAKGAKIEYFSPHTKSWNLLPKPSWGSNNTYRIKPTPHPYQHVMDAYKQGKQVQCRFHTTQTWGGCRWPNWVEGVEYRIKPEPIVRYGLACATIDEINPYYWRDSVAMNSNIKATFDPDTKELLSVEKI